MIRKYLLLTVISVFLGGALFADDDLVLRYLTAANNSYSEGRLDKAFSYINIVLSSFSDKDVPQNVLAISETIYFSYLESFKQTRDWPAFAKLKEKLVEFPYVASERITRSVRVLNTFETQDMEWGIGGGAPALAGEDSAEEGPEGSSGYATRLEAMRSSLREENILELQLALEGVRAEAEERSQRLNDSHQQALLDSQQRAWERTLAESKEGSGAMSQLVFFSIIALAGISLLIFFVVVLSMLVANKRAKEQNYKFTEALHTVSRLARTASPQVYIQGLPPSAGMGTAGNLLISRNRTADLPPEPLTEEDKKEFANLGQECRDIGAEIDAATFRKNNSKNVAELVFKIAQEMGLSQYEAMLYFCVSLVYDIGFLDVKSEFLEAGSLSDYQKEQIRDHVRKGTFQLGFVPEKYRPVFEDGVLMHHENMDGSGYPDGLSGEDIPFIARLIRVAESFVALISKRNYRDIFDKESAVRELQACPGQYDQEIVAVLEALI